MSRKTSTADRLSRLAALEGVLPTAPRHSQSLVAVASEMRRGDVAAATVRAAEWVARRVDDDRAAPATDMLGGTECLRAQVADFAQAGIMFLTASPETLRQNPQERLRRGLSTAASRVFVENDRILVETSRLVVRFMEDVPPKEVKHILDRVGLVAINQGPPIPGILRCAVLRGSAVEASLALADEDAVAFAEPDFVEQIGHRLRPNDPEFGTQWQHAVIGCERAWDYATGAGVRLAVIDNGFQANHPDVLGAATSGWFRPTPDFQDFDFVHGLAGMPDADHGTSCAGMAAARSGNGAGGCGVAFEAEVQLIACLGDQIGTQSTLASAIGYAVDPAILLPDGEPGRGADVIACSLGPNGAAWRIQNVLQDAIEFAARAGRGGLGTPVVWAATNSNFPVAADEVCSHPDVIAVGRSRQDDGDDGSGFGPELELLAPGVGVWVAVSSGSYGSRTGTSFAAPCAAGVASLVLSAAPHLKVAELRDILRGTCDKVGTLPYYDGRNSRFGFGRVNAERAVARAREMAEAN